MLQHLTISHYALIEHLDTNWMPGFSVITGETGAGKSIMLGALHLLLGGRADAKSIQAGHSKCTVEASFNIGKLQLEPFFADNDIDYDPAECIIRREVAQSGKSRAFINDTPVPAAKLKEIGTALIDIHSQHQNLLLRNEHFLIDTLDTVAGNAETLALYKDLHAKLKQAEELLKTLKEKAEKGNADKDYLQFQLSQIEEARLSEDEQTELEQELHLLSHAEDIKQAFFTAQAQICPEEESMPHKLRAAAETLRAISGNYPQAEELAQRIESVRIELDDIASELEQHSERIDYDPARLLYVEERLNTIYELEQKHRLDSVAALLSLAKDLQEQLNGIETIDDEILLQSRNVKELFAARAKAAAQLTQSRKTAAKQVADELVAALQNLGMPHAAIDIQVTPRTKPDAWGADKLAFMFSANKNIPLQDVSQIASGGEIARLMLALKALISRQKSLPTVVFDEIDTGVSGHMAEQMAKAMCRMAENCQVICITHLPQIAAFGNHHFRIYKEDSELATRSLLIPLRPEARVEEIAHMLSGAEITPAAMENAKELLYGEHP